MKLLLTSGITFGLCLVVASASAQIGLDNTPFDPGTFDGSGDPFDKNNNLGGSIKTPLKKPGFSSSGESGSRLAVQTPGIDENGYVYNDSPYGNRTYSGQRGQLKRDSLGRAFWEYGSGNNRLWRFAAKKWQQQAEGQSKQTQRRAAAGRISELAGNYARFMEGQQQLPEAREVMAEARLLRDAARRVEQAQPNAQVTNDVHEVDRRWYDLQSRLIRLRATGGTEARKIQPINDLIRQMLASV